MSNALKEYFSKGKKAKVSADSIRAYNERMKIVMPKMVADLKKDAKRAAELRRSPTMSVRKDRKD